MAQPNVFGFMREIATASTTTAGSSTVRPSGRNAQAVKVLLSELYIKWLSDPETTGVVDTVIREVLAAGRGGLAAATTPSPSPSPAHQAAEPTGVSLSSSSGGSTSYLGSSTQLGLSSSTAATAADARKTASADANHHHQAAAADADGQRGSSPSPPPSPPTRQRTTPQGGAPSSQHSSKKDGGGAVPDRTPSPVGHHTRFLGVDELDGYHHRALSPGGASPVSPNAAVHSGKGGPSGAGGPSGQPHHSVDPNIPLASHASVSLMDTAAIDSPTGASHPAPPPAASSPHLHHPTRSPSSSGRDGSGVGGGPSAASSSSGFAPPVTAAVPVATVSDITPFFSRSEPEGSLPEVSLHEIESLNAYFSIRAGGGASSRGSSSALGGGRVDIDHAKTVRKQQFKQLCVEVFGIPIWLKEALFRKIAQSAGMNDAMPLSYSHIKKFHDASFGRLTPNRRLFELLKQNARTNYLTMDDFTHMTRYLVEAHSGLEFLKQPEFQEFYCKTVAIRIMYTLEVKQSKRVVWQHFDRSDLCDVMRELDQVADINQVLRYFSYEHFYVLYCRFWELDTDRDQLLSLNDLKNYSQNATTNFVLSRVIAGAGRKPSCSVPHKMDFEDFVYFCLSEEDKNTPSAVLYWFKVIDLDCDSVLSGYELGKCFEENQRRFQEAMGEELKYEDMLCQMLDMVGANKIKLHKQGLTLADLKSCPTPANFFNMLFNVTKFLAFEHRDPFFEHQQKLQPEKCDWDRFARQEYDRMASEVGQ